jgi:hypothetical protein
MKENGMDEQPTCGKGLAQHSVIPAKLAELIAALAENLEVHMTALDLTDANARIERDAYENLATAYRQVASQLQATAENMAGYRNLPMGRHDEKAMSDPNVLAAFERFVNLEQAVMALLQEGLERDRQMLAAMGGAGSGGTSSPHSK